MVEIADIKDEGSLKAWLEEQPREVSFWIASRAAARVLPLWWQPVLTEDWARKHDLTPLPFLRKSLVAEAVAILPTFRTRRAARAARRVSYAAYGRAAIAASEAADAAAIVAAYGAAYGDVAQAARAADAAARAADAAAADAARGADTFWALIRTDAKQAAGGHVPDARPLWPDGKNPFEQEWSDIKASVAEAPDAADWCFWLDWYQAQLSGRTQLRDPVRNLDMLRKIALIAPKTWDAGPAVVNPKIREIWESYKGNAPRELELLQAADDGIVLNYNPETDRLYQEDMAAERPDRLNTAVAKLNEVRLLIREMGNLQGVLGSELFLIERAVNDHPDNATMVFFNAKAARGLLQGNIENGSCPPPDSEPVIGLLDTMLLDTQNTLLSEPSVQHGLKARAEDSSLLDSPESLTALEDAADEIADVSEGALAKELPENAGKAKDPYQPRSVRMTALVSTVSAIVQSWIIAGYARFKTALEELDDITGRTARISKNIVLIGGTGGVGYGALQVVTNSPKVEAAIKAIIALF